VGRVERAVVARSRIPKLPARRERRPRGQVSVKGRDCWWTVLVIDPLAAPLTRALAPRRRVTPDAVTAASLVLAAGAAAAFAFGRLVEGALLFQLSFLLDCIDGKLAHTRGTPNPYGPYMDAIADAGRFVLCTAGITYFLASDNDLSAPWIVALTLFPTLHYAVLMTQAAWPTPPSAQPLVVDPTPVALLRIAPRRLSKPGTTVDTEAIALTLGPLLGVPLYGLLAAAIIDGSRLVLSTAARIPRALRAREGSRPLS
jgi:phosphatidylglycerophosphate synthase